jgi:K+-transporting ATPase ATPase A chain
VLVDSGFGGSALTAVTVSNGAPEATDSAHDSYVPLGGLVLFSNIVLGEMIFGGPDTGLYSNLFVALLGMFSTGLTVGRTPEYVGTKIGEHELTFIARIYFDWACSSAGADGTRSEHLHSLAGLTTSSGAHNLFYNVTTAVAMLLGGFGLAIPAPALAGRFALQPMRESSHGAIRTDSLMFGVIIVATAVIVVALIYLPVIALGPIVEHLTMLGRCCATDVRQTYTRRMTDVYKTHASKLRSYRATL